MNPYSERTTYENPARPAAGDRLVERTERRELFMRYILPLLMCIVTFALGYALGWNAGRNDLLEETYVGDDGGMVDRFGPGVPGPAVR